MTVALETIRSLRAVTPQNTIIEAQHVGQRFTDDNGTELTVFDNISFNLYEGEIVAILGRSGAGKSTFLRALAGLVKPTSGTVKYRGKALTGPNPGIALVFQTFALMPWLTVQDNVELGLKARGVPRAERTKLALDAIDMIGLDGFESAYPKELSGGMRQRVGIARALVCLLYTSPKTCVRKCSSCGRANSAASSRCLWSHITSRKPWRWPTEWWCWARTRGI